MKNILFSLFLFTSTSLVYSQIDTVEYKLNTIKAGDSLIFQFRGKYIVNFNMSKNEKWDGGKLRMWNDAGESFLIERVNKGDIYYINEVKGNRIATLTTKGNGMTDKIMMAEGSTFTYEERRDGGWKATSDGKVYQIVRPEGLKKKPKKRKVIIYNHLSNENAVKLFHRISHLGLLHFAFIKEYEKNFSRSLGLLFLPI